MCKIKKANLFRRWRKIFAAIIALIGLVMIILTAMSILDASSSNMGPGVTISPLPPHTSPGSSNSDPAIAPIPLPTRVIENNQ